jgi:hypothetical protein
MRIRGLALVVSTMLAACGGDDGGEDGEPLVDGSIDGEYAGTSFAAEFGFAVIYRPSADAEAPILGFGDADSNVHCGSQDDTEPPSGHMAVVALDIDDFAVGEYPSQFVMIYTNVDGDFHGYGTGGASVSLTDVTDATVAGSVEWSATDEDSATYALSGSFELIRCPD